MVKFSEIDKQAIIDAAFSSIKYGLEHNNCKKVDVNKYSYELCEDRSCFVTIKSNNELRGCIGSLEPNGPLILNIVENAYRSAFCDPRFQPLTPSEIKNIDIEVSVLTIPEKINFSSEEDLLTKLHPKEDGLILSFNHHKATFLPSVWEELPTPKLFIQHLKYKAGLMPDFWDNNIIIKRYKTIKITR